MFRLLTFESYLPTAASAPHKRFFDIIWLAIMSQGDPRQGGARGRQQIKQARRIKKEFRDVSQRLPNADPGDDGRDAVTLAESGGQVLLAEDDYKKVIELIEAVPWKGGNLEDVEDALDWLDKSEKVKSKDVKTALAEQTGDAGSETAAPQVAE